MTGPRRSCWCRPRLAPQFLAESGRPGGLGEVIPVDTTGPVDIPAVAARVLELLPSAR